ncbi:MAG: hypothetical protein AAF411_15645 [Myxococcota bacterium]
MPIRGLACVLVLSVAAAPAFAQEQEEPDATRLDVERLPPEAISITRELYSHGVYVEGAVGVRSYIGGVGRLARPGPFFQLNIGYELFSWLWVGGIVEGSLHRTDAPSPPSATVFEVLNFLAQLRLQINASARVALWLSGEVGLGLTLSDVLRTYGLQDADQAGLVYGGQLGFDWHLRNRHHSIGLAGGARLHPNLDGVGGEVAIGAHGTLYLRYVF